MPSFEIPDGPATVKLDSGPPGAKAPRTGSVVFSVTNKTAAPLAGRLGVQVAGGSKADWFTIDGERERNFAPGETQTAAIRVAVPADVAPGDYNFRLRVVSVKDPDNDHTAGPVATARVAGAAAPKPVTPVWPFIVAAIVVLLIAGAAIWWFVIRPGQVIPGDNETEANEVVGNTVVAPPVATTVTVPDLQRHPLTDAEALAGRLDVTKVALDPLDLVAVGEIQSQSPAPGTVVPRGSPLVVRYNPGVLVPSVFNLNLGDAANKLRDAGLGNSPYTSCVEGPVDKVATQEPKAGGYAPKNSTVKIYLRVGTPSGNGPLSARLCQVRELRGEAVIRAMQGVSVMDVINQRH